MYLTSCKNASFLSLLLTELNRYKKRKFTNTVNLLTGETAAHPDMIQVGVHIDIDYKNLPPICNDKGNSIQVHKMFAPHQSFT